ncbi:MAG: hypothetical protein KJ856_10105 [Gammaproteobacteria bacterium]|nr:hypothetical protein [Gammaproteobacteria bacterium]MBU1479409.1 hypothetical protein [Gammaproteobacteria bacterium]MBU2002117.1 hypothetical protein [Gammaproteobacteria bacterium]MBU2187356.1 hypothetical protein [Gammaproteobacteria bacterium]MBU2297470.1 hypothetical protein [Gammaproteobacteria bacterium]
MRLLKKPDFDTKTFFSTCVSGIGAAELQKKFIIFSEKVVTASLDYDSKSSKHELYMIIDQGIKDKDLCSPPFITKDEFKKLYENQVAKEGRPGRSIYNNLLITKNKRCPFCSVGKVKNLDHFLPKAHFPIFSVTPINLVPSCRDCNQDKNDDFSVDIRKQSLHPYFDDVSKVKWLFAKVAEESNPPVISYYTDSTLVEPEKLALKVDAHFISYKLNDTFSDLAGEMLSDIYNYCMNQFNREGKESLKLYLLEQKESHENAHLNSWQGAMYSALANSEWYCSGKFIDPQQQNNFP